MTVIAMTREMGTLGKDVALGLAVSRGVALVHHQLIEESLAERMEIGAGDVHRFLEGNETLLERWQIDAKRLSRYTAEEILRIAGKGNVLIRGWGAASLLRGVPNVIRVRVCAPMAFRVEVMMERLGLDDAEVVRREIERNDAAHTRTVRRFFSADWESPLNYHLVLNTGILSVENCIRQVEVLAEDVAFEETAETRGLLSDTIVKTRVLATFEQSHHPGLDSNAIDVAVREGRVTLSGVTNIEADIAAAVELARGVEGVLAVDSMITHAGHEYIWGLKGSGRLGGD